MLTVMLLTLEGGVGPRLLHLPLNSPPPCPAFTPKSGLDCKNEETGPMRKVANEESGQWGNWANKR